jgi:hypothetical protein
MQSIQSIICYTGGSGGDFLKLLCLSQHKDQNINFQINSNGLTLISNHYFKLQCEKSFIDNKICPADLNFDYVNPIENTHHFLDWFTGITNKIYFIDYDDSCASSVLQTYINKRFNNNITDFITMHTKTLPQWSQNIVNEHTALKIFSMRWTKQLQAWRQESRLEPINLSDFFVYSKIKNIVQNIVNDEILNQTLFDDIYYSWVNRNHYLQELCT